MKPWEQARESVSHLCRRLIEFNELRTALTLTEAAKRMRIDAVTAQSYEYMIAHLMDDLNEKTAPVAPGAVETHINHEGDATS